MYIYKLFFIVYSLMMAEITAGRHQHCNLARPRKRGRTTRSSTRWSSGTWSGTGRMASWTNSSSTPGDRRSCRIVLTGRRRLTSCMDMDTFCVELDNIKSNLKPERTEMTTQSSAVCISNFNFKSYTYFHER